MNKPRKPNNLKSFFRFFQLQNTGSNIILLCILYIHDIIKVHAISPSTDTFFFSKIILFHSVVYGIM